MEIPINQSCVNSIRKFKIDFIVWKYNELVDRVVRGFGLKQTLQYGNIENYINATDEKIGLKQTLQYGNTTVKIFSFFLFSFKIDFIVWKFP